MPKVIEITLKPHQCVEFEQIRNEIASQYGVKNNCVLIKKKSLDARSKKNIHFRIRAEIFESPVDSKDIKPFGAGKSLRKTCHIIGFGPAGIYAALQALELGIQPIVLERGKAVKNRRRDLARINKELIVDPNSNYCFGEGGAGTYSDGKLYTRSKKKGDVQKILEGFVQFGADSKILYEAHPHIGTNKLPGIIEQMRAFILSNGGEVHFNCKVNNFEIEKDQITSLICDDGRSFKVENVILATGHSARDIYHLLAEKNIHIERKDFAIGVRIEHPQEMIDQMQYHCSRGDYLPPASYSLVHQVKDRGVFSFCMCPGGIIAPAATDVGETVVNGWSPSKRNGGFANSGLVVQLKDEDFWPYREHGPLAGVAYQMKVEQDCFKATGSIVAPAQRVSNFVNHQTDTGYLNTSYIPGTAPLDLHKILPKGISQRLKIGVQHFAKRMKGYDSKEGVMVATESRTSSPVRIPRDKLMLNHQDLSNLYPCGEGAGYAGGIVSAAIDGIRCINAIHQKITEKTNERS
jgi:hypothetical protein